MVGRYHCACSLPLMLSWLQRRCRSIARGTAPSLPPLSTSLCVCSPRRPARPSRLLPVADQSQRRPLSQRNSRRAAAISPAKRTASMHTAIQTRCAVVSTTVPRRRASATDRRAESQERSDSAPLCIQHSTAQHRHNSTNNRSEQKHKPSNNTHDDKRTATQQAGARAPHAAAHRALCAVPSSRRRRRRRIRRVLLLAALCCAVVCRLLPLAFLASAVSMAYRDPRSAALAAAMARSSLRPWSRYCVLLLLVALCGVCDAAFPPRSISGPWSVPPITANNAAPAIHWAQISSPSNSAAHRLPSTC